MKLPQGKGMPLPDIAYSDSCFETLVSCRNNQTSSRKVPQSRIHSYPVPSRLSLQYMDVHYRGKFYPPETFPKGGKQATQRSKIARLSQNWCDKMNQNETYVPFSVHYDWSLHHDSFFTPTFWRFENLALAPSFDFK